ncbi:MAG: malto-oligosyltrehalose synthase, partial [Actinomycetota bacterium]
MSPSRLPVTATYRVQLNAGFGFEDAGALVRYLSRLGVSHLYCSPYLQALPGSAHGYDVVDHGRLSDELGGPAGHAGMCAALDRAGMGHIADIVPNHMAADPRHNRHWWDVLRLGPASAYARFFDIDWDAPDAELKSKVLVPVLGSPLDDVLASGELRLVELRGEPALGYHDHVFPLAPGSLGAVSGDVTSQHSMRALLERQHYLLAYWRAAFDKLNYRRFFAINELVALRMEGPQAFAEVHGLILQLVRAGKLEGVRVDHVDGLAAPRSYLERLRSEVGDNACIVVEKILASDERLPEDWPVQGTTGYDFTNAVAGLFVDPAAEKALTEAYEGFTGRGAGLEALEQDKKLHLMRTELAPDVNRLAVSLGALHDSPGRAAEPCREVLEEVVAAFDVYRTYVEGFASEADSRRIRSALARARARRPDLPEEMYARVEDVLLRPKDHGELGEAFTTRFQQTTGPVMAKAVEDTLFYAHNRFVALNEVGGDPGRFGVGLEAFHDFCASLQSRHPGTLLATSTHDTKRSEDVRARLAVLSEMPDAWASAVARWSAANERHRRGGLPDRNTEYLLYQTLVGAWPLGTSRAVAYMEKACKEAKERTSWIDPDPAYDDALRAFVKAVCEDPGFGADVSRFVAPLIEPGRINSLAQTLIKLTAPGVPDLY